MIGDSGASLKARAAEVTLMLKTMRDVVTSALKSPARLLSDGDRSVIEAEVHDAGRLTNAYSFMLFSACGIAALGLLQSSAPVIIGAMLISPLMGPIVSMGVALARVDPRRFRTAALALVIGALLSVLASTLIVWASPLKDVTPEILARTQPTLLDLVVALLSGFVGAYLSINRKGGAIAGVAIATSLMPPLAVVGYGLATAAWDIAGGALLLFLTNVVAILVSVFGVARRYGFRSIERQGATWETPALVAVMVALCIPLALWWFIRHSNFGYETSVFADSPNTARYAGMNATRLTLSVLLISGALAGLAGAMYVVGPAGKVDPGILQIGLGYAGIVVASLARYNFVAVVITAVLFAGLRVGGAALQISSNPVPISIAVVLQGSILLFALGGEIFRRNRIRIRRIQPIGIHSEAGV